MTIKCNILQRVTFLALLAGMLLVACTGPQPVLNSPEEFTNPQNTTLQPPPLTAALPEQIRFERITSSDGLSHPYVRSIFQDHQGFLWFATANGLNLYDGYTFTVYRNIPGDPTTLDFDDLQVVYEDSDHSLWVGGAGGVDRFDRQNGTFTRVDERGQVFCILESQDGLLWVGFWHGLYAYDRATGSLLKSYPSRMGSVIEPPDRLQGYIYAIAEDSQGVLWIGSDSGLYRLDQGRETIERYSNDPGRPDSLSGDQVISLYVDALDSLWVGTHQGLDHLDSTSGTFSHHRFDSREPAGFGGDQVITILGEQSGNLWVGTQNGLVNYNPLTGQYARFRHDPQDEASLSDNIVINLSRDRAGLVWAATRGGTNKFNPRGMQFRTINYLDELASPGAVLARGVQLKDFAEMGIESFLEDQQGNLWVGTLLDGLLRLNPASGEIHTYTHDAEKPGSLSDNRVSALFQDHQGTLWVGTGGGWLEQYDPLADEFLHVQDLNARISSLKEDLAGSLWIGTSGEAAASLDLATGLLTRHRYVDPAQFKGVFIFSSHIINAIYIDQQGMPWFGTYLGGINQWLNGRVEHYVHDPQDPSSLSHNHVLSFDEGTSQDVLWVGTMGGGLNRFDRESQAFTHYTTADGLADDIVTCILGDEAGMLWLSTPRGLTRFDPQHETFWNYNQRDGVPGGLILPAACQRRADQTMIFASPGSLITFDPAQVQVNQHAPPLAVTTLHINGQPRYRQITADTAIQLSYLEHDLVFEFAALDFVSPDENSFAYLLQGVDEAWVYAGARHRADYLDLRPGSYTFHLRGANNDGVWSEQALSVKITITPPFWLTGWFIGLVGLALLGSLFAGYRLNLRRLELQRKALEKEVRERTAEINQRRKEIEALYNADESLYRYLDLDHVLQALIDTAIQLLNADKASVMCWDEQQEYLVVRAARNFQPQTIEQARIPRRQGIAGLVAESGQPVAVEDTAQDPRVTLAITRPEKIRAFIQVPIKLGREVFGVFSADYTAPRSFNQDEQRLLLALAQRAASAIQNAQLYQKAQELAATQERNRLARDLHDAVTQTLFSASLIAEALPVLWERNQEMGRDRLSKLRQLNRGALAEMRALLLELRPTALMEASLEDLVRQLGEAATGRAGFPVRVTVEGQCQPPPEVHLALYRIIQEALNNAVRHASASQIDILIECASQPDGATGAIKLSVADDGQGFDPQTGRPDKLGLKIMHERAEAIGAALTLQSQPGQGTRIMLEWHAAR